MGSFWRTVLNLPDKSPRERATRGNEGAAKADPWSAAGQAAAERGARPRDAHNSWTAVETGRAARIWQRLLRALVVAVLVFFLLAGIRTVFFSGGDAGEAQQIPDALHFPEAAASGVAERYVAAYYTWDEDDPDARAEALSVDLAGGAVESGAFGWDEKGKQTVIAANVTGVQAHSSTRATVTVRYDATPYAMEAKKWAPQEPHTSAADVTVQVIDGRVSVVGPPALVAVPPAPSVPSNRTAVVDDPAITDQTSDYAATFFRAYGEDTDVSALIAPGASIAGIGGIELDRVLEWAVQSGTGPERQATATVRWRLPEGTTLDQTYDVTVQRVTAGTTERWQVAAIHGK